MDSAVNLLLLPFILLGGGTKGTNELIDFAQPEVHWKASGMTVTTQTLITRLSEGKVGDLSALIQKLGSAEFQTRESAARDILNAGAGAIPQLKKHLKDKDFEIARRSRTLIEQLLVSDADRLIAIRVLAERKAKEAIPRLTELKASKEPFVADHARRALALIEGRALKPRSIDAALLEKDLWLLPSGCRIIAQTTFRGGAFFAFDKLFDELPFLKQAVPKKVEAQSKVHKLIKEYVGILGNIRIDAITMGTNGEFSQNKVMFFAVARGLYSPARFAAAARKQPGTTVKKVNGIDVIEQEDGAILMPSAQEMIIVYGDANTRQAAIAALRKGTGGLGNDEAMAALVKSIDRKSGGWAAVHLTERMKQKWVAPYESITAHRSMMKDGRPQVHIVCKGNNADDVKAVAGEFADDLKSLEGFAQPMVQQGQLSKATLELIRNVKVDIQGATATVTFHIPKGLDTVASSIAFVPVIALLGGEDIFNF